MVANFLNQIDTDPTNKPINESNSKRNTLTDCVCSIKIFLILVTKGWIVGEVLQFTVQLAIALIDTGALERQCVVLVNRSHVQIVYFVINKLVTDCCAILQRWVPDLVVYCGTLEVRNEPEGTCKYEHHYKKHPEFVYHSLIVGDSFVLPEHFWWFGGLFHDKFLTQKFKAWRVWFSELWKGHISALLELEGNKCTDYSN